MSVDVLTSHTNAAYLPADADLNTLTEAGYWLIEWPETVRGLAINSNQGREAVAQELSKIAGENDQLGPDEIVTQYAASIGR